VRSGAGARPSGRSPGRGTAAGDHAPIVQGAVTDEPDVHHDGLRVRAQPRRVKTCNRSVPATWRRFVAELGDKTMLATIALATREGLVGTRPGSTAGMVAADALAIEVGQLLGKRLPGKVIRWGAAASFVVFGTILLLEA
jgi:putative Ca2+/H+ antiporter (TMEM165/GDT1 family)